MPTTASVNYSMHALFELAEKGHILGIGIGYFLENGDSLGGWEGAYLQPRDGKSPTPAELFEMASPKNALHTICDLNWNLTRTVFDFNRAISHQYGKIGLQRYTEEMLMAARNLTWTDERYRAIDDIGNEVSRQISWIKNKIDTFAMMKKTIKDDFADVALLIAEQWTSLDAFISKFESFLN